MGIYAEKLRNSALIPRMRTVSRKRHTVESSDCTREVA